MTFNKPLKLGQLAGIPVAFHPICLLFLALGVLIFGLGSANALPSRWPMAFAIVGLMTLSVVLHELGHLLTAVTLKLPLRKTTLYPFGGIAQMDDTSIAVRPLIWMLLAGPLASTLQAFIWLGLWLGTDMTVALWLAQFNGAIALINLLPIASLDGGHLLAILGKTIAPPRLTSLIGFLMSLYLSLGFMFAGGAIILFSVLSAEIVWVLVGLLIVMLGILLQSKTDSVALSPALAPRTKLGTTSAKGRLAQPMKKAQSIIVSLVFQKR